MTLRFTTNLLTASEWQEACNTFESHNLYQTWDYAAHHSPPSRTRDVLRCAVLRDETPIVIGQFRIKKIPLLGVGVAELEWGPLWHVEKKNHPLDELAFFFNAAKDEILDRLKMEIRIYPDTSHPHKMDEAVGEILKDLGFGLVITETRNYDTVIIDLSNDLEVLRSNFHQKWRNLLKKAEKSKMTVEWGRDVAYFDRFIHLYDAMRKVKEFPTGVRIPVIRKMQETLPEVEKFLVTVAVEEGKDVGASVCAMTGQRMLYFLGATDPEHRGNAPGYLLQWKNIQIGKENGMRWYDLGGLVGEG